MSAWKRVSGGVPHSLGKATASAMVMVRRGPGNGATKRPTLTARPCLTRAVAQKVSMSPALGHVVSRR